MGTSLSSGRPCSKPKAPPRPPSPSDPSNIQWGKNNIGRPSWLVVKVTVLMQAKHCDPSQESGKCWVLFYQGLVACFKGPGVQAVVKRITFSLEFPLCRNPPANGCWEAKYLAKSVDWHDIRQNPVTASWRERGRKGAQEREGWGSPFSSGFKKELLEMCPGEGCHLREIPGDFWGGT